MGKMIFEGLKVLDLGTAGVGPESLQYLTRYGAKTIRIETAVRPCTSRLGGPYKDGKIHHDWTAWSEVQSSGKLGISLNYSKPKGLEIAKRLVEWADVVGENYTPGALAKWGLDYEGAKKIKPDIIYLSINAQGQYGPHANWRGWGSILTGLTGLYHFCGWPDRDPSGVFLAYTDFVAPRFAAIALAAALAHKQKTGKGQYIDVSQCETGLMYMMPMIMEYNINGRVLGRNGNKVPHAAPHGCYPCKPRDIDTFGRWITIAVTTDEEWVAFKRVIGEPEWVREPKYDTLTGRKANEDELDKLVAEWTSTRRAEDVMETMQKEGVPAGLVLDPRDQLEDPQLKHRGHFIVAEGHPNVGPIIVDAPQVHMSKTPPQGGPAYGIRGQANEYVYKEMLGMSDSEFNQCLEEGVFE